MDIRIMTWNIRSDQPSDGDHSWPHRREQVAEMIRSSDPDVAGLQEVLPHQLDDLETLLPEYFRIGEGREGAGTGEYCPIFYHSDRIALLRDGTFWLSDTPDLPGSIGWDAGQSRISSWANFQHQETGEVFFHFNTHMDVDGKQARHNSIPLLRDVIRMEAGSTATILSGDFNLTDREEEYRMLTEWMSDSRSAAGEQRGGPDGTFIGPGFETGKQPEKRIDYIFVNDGFRVRTYSVLPIHPNGAYPSDHLAVLSDLENLI